MNKKVITIFITLVVIGQLYIDVLFIQKFQADSTLIETQGIIISDAEGNQRILIGSPIPKSPDRVRNDIKRVDEYWAKDFPSDFNFTEYYQNNINSSMNGILFLDTNGHDRLAIGDPVPDLYFGKRIGPSTGIAINDSLGAERSGYGLLNINGRYRVSLGLDDAWSEEGITLSLDDGGQKAIQIKGHQNVYIASDSSSADAFSGIKVVANGKETVISEFE